MSPRSNDGWWESRPRIAVEGGVRVAKPGSVSAELARSVVDAALANATSGVISRARTYARQGQVVGVEVDAGAASAEIQGSDARPYDVELGRTRRGRLDAECTCPYGCSRWAWCKHAVALAFVVAQLIDQDPAVRDRWVGEGSAAPPVGGTAAPRVPDELLERLLQPVPKPDAAAQWAAAIAVLPPPSG